MRVTLLVPMAEEESLVVEVNLASLAIHRPKERSTLSGLFFSVFSPVRLQPLVAKEMILKSLTVHAGSTLRPASQRDILALWEKPWHSWPLLLSIYHSVVTFHATKEGGETPEQQRQQALCIGARTTVLGSFLSVAGEHHLPDRRQASAAPLRDHPCSAVDPLLLCVAVDVKSTNIELSCTLNQLVLLKKCIEFSIMDRRRTRLQAIRKMMLASDREETPEDSSSRFNAKRQWNYVLKAAILVVKEEKKMLDGGNLRSAIAKLALKRKYIALHRARLFSRLARAGLEVQVLSGAGASGMAHCTLELSASEMLRLLELEEALDVDDLACCRSVVNEDVLKAGLDISILKDIIRQKPVKSPASWMRFSAKDPLHFDAAFAHHEMLHAAVKYQQLWQTSWKLSVAVSRVAVTLFNETLRNRSPYSLGPADPSTSNCRVLSLIVNGISAEWDSKAHMICAFLGRLSVFGVNGSCLLSFGKVAEILDPGHFSSQCFQGNPDLAFSFNLQYHSTAHVAEASTVDDVTVDATGFNQYKQFESFAATNIHGNMNHYFVKPSKEHTVVEAKFSNLSIVWDTECIACLLQYLEMLHLSGGISGRSPFADEKLRLANMSRYNASAGAFAEQPKLSIGIVFHSIAIVFPLQYSIHQSRSSSTISSREKQMIEIGLDSIQLHSGDNLELLSSAMKKISSSSSDDNLTHPCATDNDGHVGAYDMLKQVLSLRTPLVLPVAFQASGIFCRYVNSHQAVRGSIGYGKSAKKLSRTENGNTIKENILRSPWTICGVISISSIYSHPDFSDFCLDLYFGPLELSVRRKVSQLCACTIMWCVHSQYTFAANTEYHSWCGDRFDGDSSFCFPASSSTAGTVQHRS
jgi:hypothetical protein